MTIAKSRSPLRSLMCLLLVMAVPHLALASLGAPVLEKSAAPEPLTAQEMDFLEGLEIQSQCVFGLRAGSEDDERKQSIVPWLIAGATAVAAIVLGVLLVDDMDNEMSAAEASARDSASSEQ